MKPGEIRKAASSAYKNLSKKEKQAFENLAAAEQSHTQNAMLLDFLGL